MDPQGLIPLAAVVITGGLYGAGWRRRVRPATGRDLRSRRLRAAAFASALLVLVVALVLLDGPADEGFWPHMVQHVLVITVAAPLLVLGEPWSMLWRPLPLGFRRGTAGWVAHAPSARALRALVRPLARPGPAFVVSTATLWLWHLPYAYDLALKHQSVHDLEHLTMLAGAILFWEQVIDSAPLRPALDAIQRTFYVSAAAVSGWLLAALLAYWPTPLYQAYVVSADRPGGVSALTDQQLAAGVMWGPGSLAYSLAVFWLIYIWLADDSRPRRRRSRHAAALREKGA
ncbi:MAG: putative rane protein [Gaiellales bacterium]|nr:putative rane protein [Gaiellales bacterium]